MAFRQGKATEPFNATMETSNATKEEREFANLALTRVNNKGRNGSSSSALLNASQSKSLGPWKSIPVGQGDVITPEVWATYTNLSNANNYNNTKLTVSLNAMPGYGTIVSGPDTQLPTYPLTNITVGVNQILTPNQSTTTLPNAYLALLFYNENNVLTAQQYVPIPSSANGAWQKLALVATSYTAPSKGRVEIFVANESNADVWFDDLLIKYEGGIIAQEMHYDPWGLELKGIGKDGNPYNKFTFNKQSEKQKDLNGGKGYFYETDWRGYDAQLGRFSAIDKLASKYPTITPYHYGYNNPIRFIDPTGLEGEKLDEGNGKIGMCADCGKSEYFKYKQEDIARKHQDLISQMKIESIFLKKMKGGILSTPKSSKRKNREKKEEKADEGAAEGGEVENMEKKDPKIWGKFFALEKEAYKFMIETTQKEGVELSAWVTDYGVYVLPWGKNKIDESYVQSPYEDKEFKVDLIDGKTYLVFTDGQTKARLAYAYVHTHPNNNPVAGNDYDEDVANYYKVPIYSIGSSKENDYRFSNIKPFVYWYNPKNGDSGSLGLRNEIINPPIGPPQISIRKHAKNLLSN